MATLSFILLIVIFTYFLLTSIEFLFGFNQLKNLSTQPCLEQSQLPTVSIILTALNEEKDLENTLLALNNLNYPNFEIIAVNDRSTDKTADILTRLQKKLPRLKVYHINTLPQDWFGKNHGLHVASQYATGEWILFTDADVLMEKDALLKAMSYTLQNKLDHLTIFECHSQQRFWLNILLLGHYITYSMVMKPWRIRYSWSKKSLGHAAFNLVKRKSYEDCGGHQPISLECLDDLKLGELLKKNGYSQDTVDGKDLVKREWYCSVKEMISGMEKNSFAFYNYRLLALIRDLILVIFVFIFPLVIAVSCAGWLRWVSALDIALTLFISAYVAKHFRVKLRYAMFYPLAICMLTYSILNSVIATYRNKGVIWRGTHYPLHKIKSKI